jgi:hypothetical protein
LPISRTPVELDKAAIIAIMAITAIVAITNIVPIETIAAIATVAAMAVIVGLKAVECEISFRADIVCTVESLS